MKKVYISLREHATNAIFEKKKMLSLTKKELTIPKDATKYYIFAKHFKKNFLMMKIIEKLETSVILQVYIEVQHIGYVI